MSTSDFLEPEAWAKFALYTTPRSAVRSPESHLAPTFLAPQMLWPGKPQ
ncbi:MAG: hypothetical protein ACJAV2_003597 [Myxococcota bacterium]|jgi:hypothetical protein